MELNSPVPHDDMFLSDVKLWEAGKAETLRGALADLRYEVKSAIDRLRTMRWANGVEHHVIMGYDSRRTLWGRSYYEPVYEMRMLWCLGDSSHVYIGMDGELYESYSCWDKLDRYKNLVTGVHPIDDDRMKWLTETGIVAPIDTLISQIQEISVMPDQIPSR